MSNPLAISAVTATLRELISEGIHKDNELADATVTTQSLDKARGNNTSNQINIFLYHTSINAAFRNTYVTSNLKPGEIGNPPLALNLHYLITAYGRDDDDILGHRLLSRAMSVLHDHPLLEAERIRISLSGNDLHEQTERVRVIPQPLTLEELSKLWTTFQTQYRISAAYEVSVVLIDSMREVRSPLPVINRGESGGGATVLASLPPVLESIALPGKKSSAEIGDTVAICGKNLDGDIKVYFLNAHLDEPMEILPMLEGTSTEVSVTISKNTLFDSSLWVAGFYTIYAVIRNEGRPDLISNSLPLPVAPQITDLNPRSSHAGDVDLILRIKPEVRPKQRVYLLFGDRQIPAEQISRPTDVLTFSFKADQPGKYLLRLRVDGVDSIPLDRDSEIPKFDEDQKVTIT